MSQAYKLCDPAQPGPSKETPKTDWTRCVLCQTVTTEALQCPAESKRHDIGTGQGYSTFAENLVRFQELQELPLSLDLRRLDEGGGIENTLLANKAKWHKYCLSKFSAARLQRAEKRKGAATDSDLDSTATRKYTRQSHEQDATSENVCFFCEKISTSERLHEVSTFRLDSRVRQCALDLQDQQLLAKLSAGDLVAQEAKYHAPCLASLYNKAAALNDQADQENETTKINHGIALAELLSYIEDAGLDDEKKTVFKLADLTKLYSARLEQLGSETNVRIHSTRLKNRILAHIPDLSAHKEGRDVLLAFKKDIGPALRKACEDNYDDEAICLSKAAKIVRRDMFEMEAVFMGSFDQDCQKKAVPQSLLALVSMILCGSNILTQTDGAIHQATLSMAQLLLFNSSIRRRSEGAAVRHNKARETPLPMYVGLTVHSRTRKRELVETLFELGMSISYDRVLEISTEMGNRVCEQYHRDQVVCPPNLRQGLFTTAAVDNIDHNPSSTTSTDSFHGTGISLFQHPDPHCLGTDRREHRILVQPVTTKVLLELPESYTNVRALTMSKKDSPIPKAEGPVKGDGQVVQQALQEEAIWLEEVEKRDLLDIHSDSNISWAAYHASQQPTQEITPAITALLPLFPDDSKSVAMIRHSMDVIKQAVQDINPDQVPVITLDQPLYAIAKRIQWYWPANYGEDNFIIILGGLHTEMAALKVIGDWLEDSGWTGALVQAKVASSGTADSFLKAAHVTRTRHAHQVTASSLYILLKKAYTQYTNSLESGSKGDAFDEWCSQHCDTIPQFMFWYTALQLELLVLTYVRSLRTADFSLYVDSLTKLAPWMFSMDHINYARWLPVHIRDMASLREAHPEIEAEFKKGSFVVQKSKRVFSTIAIDQAHEQNNAIIKSDGGAVGLTQSPAALRRWMLAGPEVMRLTAEFEVSLEAGRKEQDLRHHEQTKGSQLIFAQHVQNLVEVFEEMGNPFLEGSNDLLRLDTRDIVDPVVVSSIREAEDIGQQKYQRYVNDRLLKRSVSIMEPIKKSKLSLFSRPPTREQSKSSLQVASLKSDCSLFSRLYIACQSRDGNLADFFRHENQACPPSLSLHGKLRSGTKSDLLVCLEGCCVQEKHDTPKTNVTIIDGAVLVNILKPLTAKTFREYALNVICPYIQSQLQHADRVDVVWDQYQENSLKAHTRSKRGKGIRRRVEGATSLPQNWQQFLRVDENKTELFEFLAEHISRLQSDKQVVSTYGTEVLCNPARETTLLAPCSHEEADSRMILHLKDAVQQGFQKILLRTVDTDVVVLAVAAVANVEVQEVWIAFGTGQHFRYIAAHEISASIGPAKSKALQVFHAYTGCDTVSFFSTRGKKTAWDTWKAFEEVTPIFLTLSTGPNAISDAQVTTLERFTILLYDRTSSKDDINEARQDLFAKKGRAMDAIPPSQAALLQHIKRAVHQGGHCWGRALEVAPELPSPSEWEWVDPSDWRPFWTTLPEASSSARELVRCGCKKGCKGRCKCKQAGLKCTALCECGGKDCAV